ncbi:phosphoribosylaminoimidazolesuccinocarboxamide synthase [Microlunatus soli]|uniref:Phosphoribosylaminoimidazole-succinocarboxamide synthase n=1 Tax=Microlunatus soli TaxID=630515 RepID=A0A1H1WAG0_9ACTN|nr:phosphoribosylaminoimidazolesuccinocarboxamide synthase [Microlunatus soli]SDS94093.1 phosphoribosylaminoimidazole-succinocarboxamide synthase [Microlunatus soli]
MPLDEVAAIAGTADREIRRAQLIEHRRRLAQAAHRAAARVDAMDRMIEREDVVESALRVDEGAPLLTDRRMAKELHGTLDRTDFGHLGVRHEGKVRDSYVDGDVRTIVTTDRLSAFDRYVGTIPFKGQILNAIANYWFDATADIVSNHLLEVPDPNVWRVRECTPIPLEFVVRGYATGVTNTSLWVNYEAGERNIAGNLLPEGLRRNERLPAPILTPTTKFEIRDRNLSRADAIADGLVTAELFDRCADVCFRLFARGTELAARRGLILVDTKYELGLLGDEIVLIDEIHTPDSSRYWYADRYDELFQSGEEQRSLDKEPLREWLVERGFHGEGEAPVLTDEVRIATATRYILLAEELTQQPFQAAELTAADRVARALES